jgi:hypothetical protein
MIAFIKGGMLDESRRHERGLQGGMHSTKKQDHKQNGCQKML